MANYPTSKDDATSLPNPTGASKQNNPDHGALHTAENAAIIALETKLGTGATAPAVNTLLLGTGAGTSAWSQATSAQLAASISDETGSGSAVFATSPTLITPKIDTIQEATLNNGVTVAGLNIKSGALNTASSVTTAALADSAVTPAKLLAGTGTSWAWQSWVPTWTNVTVGNGSVSAKFAKVGTVTHFKLSLIFGSSTVISGSVSVTLPVTSVAIVGSGSPLGSARLIDISAGLFYTGIATHLSTTTMKISWSSASGSGQIETNLSSVSPATWTTGDEWHINGFYEGL